MKHQGTRRHASRQGLWAIFAAPALIFLASAIALVSALTGDGWRDVVSWLGLAVPVLITAWAMRYRSS